MITIFVIRIPCKVPSNIDSFVDLVILATREWGLSIEGIQFFHQVVYHFLVSLLNKIKDNSKGNIKYFFL